MPGRDQSGPEGLGQKTGRGLGNCSGSSINTRSFWGGTKVKNRNLQNGKGLGFGRKNRVRKNNEVLPKQDNLLIQKQIEELQQQLTVLEKQLAQST